MPLRSGRLPFAALLVGLAVAAGGCAPEPPWNLLVVTFDTTRADRLGCYGNDTIQTPHLDALAAEGVRFERAYAAVPITAPSHSTILTGRYPISHGIRDNGLFVLAPEQQTLAEILRERGYATGAAIGSFPLVRRFGLDQGFDLYDDHIGQRYESLHGNRAIPVAGMFFEERRAGAVNAALLPWLEDHAVRPFFAWVHYFDPHHPLAPPAPYDQLYASDPYDGELAYADESFGVLVARLRELGVWHRTVVVFTSDHGEGQGEHGEETHSLLLYNGTLRVPLIVRVPGGAAGAVIEESVGTVDILPTVLELLGVPVPAGVQGRSLAAFVRDGHGEPRGAPLYAETLSPRLSHGWGELRALVSDGWKYVHGPRPELYDLSRDPRELDDRLAAEPGRAERMREQLARFLVEEAAADLPAPAPVDESTRSRLEALGYLQNDDVAEIEIEEVLREEGTPPQDRVRDVSGWSLAKSMIAQGQPFQALRVLEGLLEADPTNARYLELQAQAELAAGHPDRALAALERIEAGRGSGTARLLLQIGIVTLHQGEAAEAEALWRRSIAEEPTAEAWYLLASLAATQGRADAEREALEESLRVDPSYAPAKVDLAVRLAQEGRAAEAERAFQRVSAEQPYFPRLHHNYGTFLAQAGRLDEASGAFARALELEPGYTEARYGLLVVELERGHRDEAIRQLGLLRERAPESDAVARATALLDAS
jgi:arylsulfatase A-like enzyme/Tfp pilus assembly protein PilF